MALLELENVDARYGQVKALHGVSLRVPEGRMVALLGANGAGKTTPGQALDLPGRRRGRRRARLALGLAFGAALIEFLPVHAQDVSKTAPDVIFGAVLIAVMILLPAGAAGLLRRLGTLRR